MCMRRSCQELSIGRVVDEFIVKNNQITFYVSISYPNQVLGNPKQGLVFIALTGWLFEATVRTAEK